MKLNEVHSDERRTISVISGLLEDEKEFNIIELKPGKAIGGCIHENDEYFVIIKGTVSVFIGHSEIVHHTGQSGVFLGGVAHGFYSEKGAIISEFGITEEEKIKSKKDKFLLIKLDNLNEENGS